MRTSPTNGGRSEPVSTATLPSPPPPAGEARWGPACAPAQAAGEAPQTHCRTGQGLAKPRGRWPLSRPLPASGERGTMSSAQSAWHDAIRGRRTCVHAVAPQAGEETGRRSAWVPINDRWYESFLLCLDEQQFVERAAMRKRRFERLRRLRRGQGDHRNGQQPPRGCRQLPRSFREIVEPVGVEENPHPATRLSVPAPDG